MSIRSGFLLLLLSVASGCKPANSRVKYIDPIPFARIILPNHVLRQREKHKTESESAAYELLTRNGHVVQFTKGWSKQGADAPHMNRTVNSFLAQAKIPITSPEDAYAIVIVMLSVSEGRYAISGDFEFSVFSASDGYRVFVASLGSEWSVPSLTYEVSTHDGYAYSIRSFMSEFPGARSRGHRR